MSRRRPLPYDPLKRALDIAVSVALLVVAAPVLAVLALAVRLSLGGPVLFRQQRPGRDGRLFTLYKFRTMRPLAPGEVEGAESDARRLGRFGRLLRSTSLDELPELWNVLTGTMSLVGPRPLLAEYLPLYTETQARRHEVRPGITGWAQVNGRNSLRWPDRLALDVWYVDHRSLRLDARILLLTVVQVVLRRGISQDGQATMERFTGAS